MRHFPFSDLKVDPPHLTSLVISKESIVENHVIVDSMKTVDLSTVEIRDKYHSFDFALSNLIAAGATDSLTVCSPLELSRLEAHDNIHQVINQVNNSING